MDATETQPAVANSDKQATTPDKPIPRQQLVATQVGDGVARRSDIGRPKVKSDALPPKTIWLDQPQFPDQIANADLVKLVKTDVHVLDLSTAEGLLKYQELLDLEFFEKSNRYILNQERRFDEVRGRFVVYAEVGTFKFKAILPKDLHGKN